MLRQTEFFNALRAADVGICLCWKITRTDGEVMAFTSHDRSLTYDGLVYEHTSAFGGSAVAQTGGMAVDNLSIAGITSDDLTEEDLLAGRYDEAEVQVYLALWTHPGAGLLPVKRGFFGEVTTKGQNFETEVRGLAERLQRNMGLTYALECSATLGDARCGVDLSAFTHTGTVTSKSQDDRAFRHNLNLPGAGYLKYGYVQFTSGRNAGRKVEVIEQRSNYIMLLERLPFPIENGDEFTAVAGCSKLHSVCKSKFSNLLNFRGFPFMPTEEEAMETPVYKVD